MLTPDRLRAWLAAESPSAYAATVSSPHSALAHLIPHLTAHDGSALDHERFAVLALGSQGRVVDCDVLTVGSARNCIVDAAQVYRWALTRQQAVASIIVAHNHPSGVADPSPQDKAVTSRLQQAGAMLGIALLDHLVIGGAGRYYSFAESGEIPATPAPRDYTG